MIHHLPNLTKLDNNVVTQEEKVAASNPKYTLDFNVNTSQYRESQVQNTPEPPKRPEVNNSDVKRRPYSEVYKEERVSQEPAGWKGGSNRQIVRGTEVGEEQLNRNKNILIAVLSLMKELDPGSLEIVRTEAEKELRNR